MAASARPTSSTGGSPHALLLELFTKGIGTMVTVDRDCMLIDRQPAMTRLMPTYAPPR